MNLAYEIFEKTAKEAHRFIAKSSIDINILRMLFLKELGNISVRSFVSISHSHLVL